MVVVCLNGRLGNQLFQYAFAISLSKRYNTFYLIDDRLIFDYVRKYFVPTSYTDNKYLSKLLRKIYTRKNLEFIEQKGFEDIKELIRDNAYYEGFFQSVSYIDNISSALKNIFCIKTYYKELFTQNYSYLFEKEKVVVVHYRMGDYLTWGGEILGGYNMALPESYYENALRQIPNIDSYRVVLVTDDAEGVKSKLKFIANKIVVSNEELILDFQILMHADKLVISNSTFAWWAATLNCKNAQVFAPEYWIGFKIKQEYPFGIISSNFVKVPF